MLQSLAFDLHNRSGGVYGEEIKKDVEEKEPQQYQKPADRAASRNVQDLMDLAN